MRQLSEKKVFTALGKIITPVIAILVALIITGIFISSMGFQPLDAYKALFQGAFQNKRAICETVVSSVPLLFSALSFAVAYQSGIFNLGASGQIYFGALFATLIGTVPDIPAFIHLPLTLLAGIIGGMLWGSIIGILKNRFRANEMITSIMLNYVAMSFISFCVAGPMKRNAANGAVQSEPVMEGIRLTRFISGTRLHTGLFIAIVILIAYSLFFKKTTKGYEMRVMGMNPAAAEYSGINTRMNIMLSMLLSSGIAGLGGCIEILGIQYSLAAGFAGNIGFDGITVALMGNCTPVGILISSLLFGALKSGSNKMQMSAGVPSATTVMMQGIIIVALLLGPAILSRVKAILRRSGR